MARKCNMCKRDFDNYDYLEGLRFDFMIPGASRYCGHQLDLDLCEECAGKLIDTIISRCTIFPIAAERSE